MPNRFVEISSSPLTELYLELNNNFNSPACIVNIDGSILKTTDYLEQLLGYSNNIDNYKLFSICPDLSILKWRDFWNNLEEKNSINNNMLLMKENGEIFESDIWAKKIITDEFTVALLIFKPDKELLTSAQKSISKQKVDILTYSLDNSNDMIYWTDRAGNLAYFNRALSVATGFSFETLKQMKAWDFSTEVTNAEEWTEYFETVEHKTEPHVVTTEQFRKDGGINVVEATSTFLTFQGKDYVFSIVRDVSDQRKKTKALALMQFILDNSETISVIVHKNGEFIYFNEPTSKTTLVDTNELKKKKIWDATELISDEENWNTLFQTISNGEGEHIIETVHTDVEGTQTWYELTANYIIYDGNPSVYINAKDITDRKLKNRSLEQLKIGIDKSDKLITMIKKDGKIIFANQPVLTDSGYSNEEIKQLYFWELIDELSQSSWEEMFDKAKQQQSITIFQNGRRKDGSLIQLKLTLNYATIESDEFITSIAYDITNETKQLKQLKQLNTALQHANNAIFCVKADGRIFYANKQLSINTGYSIDKLLKTYYWEIMPDIKQSTWNSYWKKISSKSYIEHEYIRKKNNGKTITLKNLNYFIKDEVEPYMLVIGFDISKEKQRLQMLERMKKSLDQANDFVLRFDRHGKVVYANQAIVDVFGFTHEELLTMNFWELTSDIKKNEWQAFWKKMKETPHYTYEGVGITKEKRKIPIDVSCSFIEIDGIQSLITISKDISEKKQTDLLLHKMKESLDQGVEMVLWLNEDADIIYANQSLAKKTGYTVDELKKMKLFDVAPNVSKNNWKTRVVDNFKKGTVEPYDSLLKLKNGKSIEVEVSGSSIEYDGELILITIVRDVTQRNLYQNELKQKIHQLNEIKIQLEDERTYLEEEISSHNQFNEIITQNKQYRKLLEKIPQVADTNTTVLITGETGTGKELIARAIHNLSNRASEKMVKVNCAAIPANLIESELFGHVKGSFTGAYQDKVGKFQIANNGTIFLDEIGEMPIELQSKLLRVLQEGEFEPIGSNNTFKVDVRVISATNKDLLQEVEKGKFREDLYYRINVFPIHNMPLRDRKDDIPVLVNYFVEKFCKKMSLPVLKVNQATVKQLSNYEYPGNIRELENIIERAVILSKGNLLSVKDVIPSIYSRSNNKTFLTLDEMQKQHIITALEKCNWKVSGKNSASELLNINGKTLASRIKKLGIERFKS